MFAEELAKIKEAEAKADELQKKAKIESRQALAAAGVKADQIVENAENRAKEMYDSMLAEGEKISRQQYDLFLDETEKQCRDMAEKAAAGENKAVDLIAERIVSGSVNS